MKRWLSALLAAALGLLGSCSSSYLFDPTAGRHGMVDRSLRVAGRFCTEGTDDLARPIKLLFAMDTSESMSETDPDGTRAKALIDLLNSLPDSPEIEVGVLLFAGDVTWLTSANGIDGFVQLQSLDPTARNKLAATILSYAFAGGVGGANRDTTDFIKPLAEIFATISADISKGHQAAISSGNPQLSRYSVVFLSDGHPREGDGRDNEIFQRCASIRALKSDAGDVTLNTVYVFNPTQPIPTYCAPDAATCQEEMIEKDSNRLRLMAEYGGGEFRSFRDGEPINFLSMHLGGIKRSFLVKAIQVFNLNSRPGSDVLDPDSDGDGLSDADELSLGTDPTKRDTDEDGYSDGVEIYFRARTPRDPTNQRMPFDAVWRDDGSSQDRGCPMELRGKDLDNDGLLDCDELLIGTSNTRFDTDSDGMPDIMEWLGGTQPSSPDDQEDPDRDGLTNFTELRMHTDPLVAEDAHLTDRAYRYSVVALPVTESTGSTCYDFTVDNVLLVPTLDTGEGPGVNHLMMTVVETSGGDVTAAPIYRVAHFSARFPTGGIKDPPDGIVPLSPADFVAP